MSVYVFVSSGTVAVAWYAPVSQRILSVSATLWFRASVYVAWLAAQEANTSIAEGVARTEV